ncbi:MAG TPA: lytic transglycosylase domain-containing protein [Vicinamibacterales bacterium]
MTSRLHVVRVLLPALAASVVGTATPAAAELVFLTSGRSVSVKSIAMNDTTATLVLRSGGEVVMDRAAIARVEPDEVDWSAIAEETAPAPEARRALPREARVRAPEIPATYRGLVRKLSETHGVDVRLVHAVIAVESAYKPRARSPKGARGLMQLMPATARQYGVRNAYNPSANLDAGIRHLRSLLDRFEVRLALAAYNAGEAAVRRFGGIPPYRETQEYVAKVLAVAGLDSRP